MDFVVGGCGCPEIMFQIRQLQLLKTVINISQVQSVTWQAKERICAEHLYGRWHFKTFRDSSIFWEKMLLMTLIAAN